jgi:hypothetical protein
MSHEIVERQGEERERGMYDVIEEWKKGKSKDVMRHILCCEEMEHDFVGRFPGFVHSSF